MAESKQRVQKTFFSGVLLLSLSTVLVKVIGLLYKIPMLAYLGAQGMGYFQSAYEIYALFCVIATAGLPVALSVLVSAALAKGIYHRAQRIYRVSMLVFLAIGALGSVGMYVFADRFCDWIKSENAFACIRAISPTVLLVCVSSALRGWFQGQQNMLPTALSQLIESVGKLIFGLFLAHRALMAGYEAAQVAAAAGVGLTLGTLVSMLYLFWEKLRNSRHQGALPKSVSQSDGSGREILSSLAKLAIPMTLGAMAVSLTKLVDMAMILRRLQTIGMGEADANQVYGSYTTLALSVYGLLPALVNAIALPLLPMLSSAIACKDLDRQEQMIKTSYRLTAMVSIPAALGITAFARPILQLLFHGEADAIQVAAPLLALLGASIFLSCMITATNSVLHAYRSVNRPILSMLIGAAIKLIAAYYFIGLPQIGIFGAPISTLLCNVAVVGLNLYFADRMCRIGDLTSVFLRPFAASTLSIGLFYCIYLLLSTRMGESALLTLLCLAGTVLLYIPLACRFGVFGEEELCAMPGGEKLYHLLLKMGLMQEKEGSEKKGIG